MIPDRNLLSLTNPLGTVSHFSTSASALDSIPPSFERSLRYNGSLLTQSAGILLQLSQDTISRAIVTFQRFFSGPDGGSFRLNDIREISSAAVFLAAKLSAAPATPRSVLNVYAYLLSIHSPMVAQDHSLVQPDDKAEFTITEGVYQTQRLRLMENEVLILKQIGYNTKIILPHPIALTYLQTFSLLPSYPTKTSQALASRTIAYLNSALLSPQLLYLTHQPHELAVAAIYISAKEVGAKVSNLAWWEVFDVSREDLGFLVVALRSIEGWIREEAHLGAKCFTASDVEIELGQD